MSNDIAWNGSSKAGDGKYVACNQVFGPGDVICWDEWSNVRQWKVVDDFGYLWLVDNGSESSQKQDWVEQRCSTQGWDS